MCTPEFIQGLVQAGESERLKGCPGVGNERGRQTDGWTEGTGKRGTKEARETSERTGLFKGFACRIADGGEGPCTR